MDGGVLDDGCVHKHFFAHYIQQRDMFVDSLNNDVVVVDGV
jgi:hypothetical protein